MNARFHQLLANVFCSGTYLPDELIGNTTERERAIEQLLKQYPDIVRKINEDNRPDYPPVG